MSCNEWKVKRLDDIVDVIDSLHKSPKYIDQGYPMIRVKDLEKGFLKFINPAYVSKEVFEEFNKKHKPKYGDILMSRVGSYGIVTFVNTDEDFCLGQNTVVITNYKTDIDNRFLYYILTSNIISEQVEKLVTGSTQKTISMASIKSLLIPTPDILEQKAISNILSSLDKKIELNNEMNRTLEEISQALFKRWFVDFEFPNEEGKPYKSSGGEMVESELGVIPKGWNVNNLKDISTITMGVSPSSNSYNDDKVGLPLLNGAADFEGKLIKPSKYTSEPKKVCKCGDMIFGVRATIGNTVFADKEYALGRGVASVSPKNYIFREFIYFCLNSSMNKLINSASGSVFLNLKKADITDLKLCYSEVVINKFNKIAKELINKVIENDIESEILKQQRDSLLPKLMSGEIRVDNVETDI